MTQQIQENQENLFQSEGINTVIDATISDTSKAFVFDILRNKIYSNKIGATVRETISNAKDAHTAAGKNSLPIYIEIPDRNHPFFIVQDWGTGMSPQTMKEVYMDYGSSSKREKENNSSVVGKFGIGASSIHSYTDSFTITTVVDGIKYFYVNALNGKLNQLNLLGQEPTNEGNGTIISVPVRSQDIAEFEREIFFYTKYWSVQPTFNREWSTVHGGKLPQFPNIILQGTDWKLDSTSSSICLVGEVPTPIRIQDQSFQFKEYWTTNTILEFGADEVDVPVSREFLEYTNKTKAAIQKKLNTIQNELINLVFDQVKKQPTLIDAIKYFYTQLPSQLTDKLPYPSFNNVLVKKFYQLPFELTCHYKAASYSKKTKTKATDNIEVIGQWGRKKDFIIVINDTGKKSYFKKDELLEEYGVDTIYYIPLGIKDTFFENESDYDQVVEKYPLLKELEALRLSEIHTPKPRQKRNYEKKEKGMMTAYEFKGGYYGGSGIYSMCQKAEISVEADDSNFAYFEIVGLKNSETGVENLFPYSSNKYANSLQNLKELLLGVKHLNPDLKIYGVTSANISKLEGQWIHVSKYIQEYVLNKLEKSEDKKKYYPALTSVEYAEFLLEVDRDFNTIRSNDEFTLISWKLLNNTAPYDLINWLAIRHPIVTFLNKVRTLKEDRSNLNNDIYLTSFYTPLNPPQLNKKESDVEVSEVEIKEEEVPVLVKEFLSLKSKYPLIDTLLDSKATTSEIADYVYLVDNYQTLLNKQQEEF